MLDRIYEWIQNIAFYLVLVTAVMEVIPSEGYKKYIRFFTGMVLILLTITPILKLSGMEDRFYTLYRSEEYEQEKREIEKQGEYFEQADLFDFLPEEYVQQEEQNSIEVEEIRIGEEMETVSGADER